MSAYHSLTYHVTFSTKHRTPWIEDAWVERLHSYLGGTIKQMDGIALTIGGVEDHVHLLISLKTTHRISDVMRDVKKSSSMWVHEEIGFSPFEWQDGYAIFTVSPTVRNVVSRYIANQKEHLRKISFREELVRMLEESGVVYDPKYLE